MTKVTIILPVYKGQELTEKCLESIGKNTKYPYKILVIADEPKAGYEYYHLLNWQLLINMEIVIRKERLGPISAYNLGMRITKGDVLLTQNDIEEFPDLSKVGNGDCWLTRLVKASTKLLNVGMVGCLNSVRINQPINFVGTWCCYIPRTTINKIGYLDEIFGFAMMDDVDYGMRCKINRLEIVREESFEVKHLNSGTLKQLETETMKKKAAEIYKEKWADYREDMTDKEKEKYNFW